MVYASQRNSLVRAAATIRSQFSPKEPFIGGGALMKNVSVGVFGKSEGERPDDCK